MGHYRPKPKLVAGHDANHFVVRDFLKYVCGGFERNHIGTSDVYLANLRGVRVGAIDTSAQGGPWLDWLVFAGESVMLVEVKTEAAHTKNGHSLTDNEAWTFQNLPMRKRVVCNDEQVARVFAELLIDIEQAATL